MASFWHNLPRPFYVLAPMEAVTDVVFRHVVTRAARPDVYFTEFTNATGWYRAGDKAISGRLVKTDDETLIVAQLWGSDPEAMAAMSKHVAALGYDGIDLNMGCPDQSAVKAGGGAGMIRTPAVAAAIIAAAKQSGLPVSVKTRLGYTYIDEWREWLRFILEQDIDLLTIHLRTKKEMSKVPAHFELIPAIKQLRDEVAPQTLLVINGDIRNRAHGDELVREYGVDGVMIGRGIFTNPFCFAKSNTSPLPSSSLTSSLPLTPLETASLRADKSARAVDCFSWGDGSLVAAESDKRVASGGATPAITSDFSEDEVDQATGPVSSALRAEHTAGGASNDGSGEQREKAEVKQILLNLLYYHLDQFDYYQPQMGRPFETLKRFFKIYIRDFDGASDLRDQLMHTKTTDDVRAILDKRSY